MSTSTPWGPSHHVNRIAPGIISYSTGSHGGIHLSPSRLAAMPKYMAAVGKTELGTAGGAWFEEDCDWCVPALCFESEFRQWAGRQPWTTPDDYMEAARRTLKNWHPDVYEQFFGVQLGPADSYLRSEEGRRLQTAIRTGVSYIPPAPEPAVVAAGPAGPVVQTALFSTLEEVMR